MNTNHADTTEVLALADTDLETVAGAGPATYKLGERIGEAARDVYDWITS